MRHVEAVETETPRNCPKRPRSQTRHKRNYKGVQDFAIQTVSMEEVIDCVFLVSKAGKFKISMVRVPYDKLLTNLANSSRTGEYWYSVVFVPTSLRSVRSGTATTSGQYSPVRPKRTVSKRLIFFAFRKLTEMPRC